MEKAKELMTEGGWPPEILPPVVISKMYDLVRVVERHVIAEVTRLVPEKNETRSAQWADMVQGWNDCREEMIDSLDKL